MSRHIVKYDHEDGEKLPKHKRIIWCGIDAVKIGFDFTFTDANHAILSIDQGSSIEPCKNCLKAIKKVIDNG